MKSLGIIIFIKFGGSLPVRGAWIEIPKNYIFVIPKESLPVRGAWIEITMFLHKLVAELVAPRKGSVD